MTQTGRALAIMNRLIERTEQGAQEWEQEQRVWSFRTSIGPGSARIASQDDDDRAPYIFELLTENGMSIEAVSTETPGRDWTDPLGTHTRSLEAHNNKLERLYRLARSQAYGLDEVLSEIERALDLGSEGSD